MAAAYTFLELQNMYSARLVFHTDSSSTFQTQMYDMILHYTIESHVGVLMYSMSLMVLYQTSSDLSYGRRGRTAALCLRKTGQQSQVWILP
jgi:formate hydrogenlyase subunit 3/multisubunit Na+/H+ antiporter MnhD subunit